LLRKRVRIVSDDSKISIGNMYPTAHIQEANLHVSSQVTPFINILETQKKTNF
jgi:hypothetical protein